MPFPSSRSSHFQNEAKYKTFLLKTRFILLSMALHLLAETAKQSVFRVCVFKCARTAKQKVLREAEKGERD